MLRPLILTLIALAPAPALAGPPDVDDLVQGSIRHGWREDGGSHIAALHLKLAPHWKTYWRAPGESGIPPAFDWSGSSNLRAVQPQWPVPQVFHLNGMRSIGYVDELVLPLRVAPVDPSRPVRLEGRIDIGICKDICMPVSLELSADLAPGGSVDALIRGALRDMPQTAGGAGVGRVSCQLEPLARGMRMTATIEVPPQGGEETVVFEPHEANLWAGETLAGRRGGALVAEGALEPTGGGGFSLDRSALVITVIGENGAVEITGCRGE